MVAALRVPQDIRLGRRPVASLYDRHEHILERREALVLWSAYIEQLKSNDGAGLAFEPVTRDTHRSGVTNRTVSRTAN